MSLFLAYLPVIKKGALDWLVLAPFPFLSVLFLLELV